MIGKSSMKYMLLIYGEENALDQAAREDCYDKSTQLAHDLQATGKFLGTSPLHPTSKATSVRIREGKRLITDGPFAETHEQLGGYFLIEAANLDDAIDIAGRIPSAQWGTVEIRPILELPNLPKG
jgi:hypothetical protein